MPYAFETFFAANPKGEGQLVCFSGKLVLETNAAYTGKWDETRKRLILDEYLEFGNGQSQHRVWRFQKNGIYRWQGDCPGDVQGQIAGDAKDNEVQLRLQFMYPVYQAFRIPVNCHVTLKAKSEKQVELVARFSLLGFTFAILTLMLAK